MRPFTALAALARLARLARLAPLLSCLAFSAAAQAGEVQVAVAANFAVPIARIGQAFTVATGHVLKLSTGSTGKFYAQVLAGAPFEVLLAADAETPRKLIAAGHAVAGSNFTPIFLSCPIGKC